MKLLKLLALLSLLVFFSCSKSQDSKDASDGDDIEMVDGEGDDFYEDEDVEIVDGEEGWEDDEFYEDGEELAEDEGWEDEEWDDEGFDEELADEGGFEDEGFDEGFEDDATFAEDVGGDDIESLEAAEASVVSDASSDFESVEGAPLADAAPMGDMPVAGDVPAYDDAMAAAAPMDAAPVQIADAGATSTYSVQPNETLMLISFKLYGDYTRWREIQSLNNDKLAGSTVVSPGMQLRYNTQGSGFVWNPQGNPYLIQRGDTLGIISDKVYGTMMKWRKIWDNNKPLIRDPNKIFAGFTIYYIPEEGRELASDPNPPVAEFEEAAPAVEQAPAMEDVQEQAFEDEGFGDEGFPEEI